MNARDLRRLAKRDGWTISTTQGNHLRLDHPEANGPVFTGLTPSDHRAIHNALAMMKRARRKPGCHRSTRESKSAGV